MSHNGGVWQDVNAWASLAMAAACLAFVTTYAVLARWWTTYEGRIMMGKAVALTLLGLYTFLITHCPDSTWLRIARVAVVSAIGLFMVFQTLVMTRAQLRRRRRFR